MKVGKPSNDIVEISTISQGQAADMLNVSRASVNAAKKVLDKGAPAVVAAVESDKLARDLEAILRPKAKENQRASGGDRKSVSANLREPIAAPIKTSKEAAKVADWRFGCKRFAPAARRTGRGSGASKPAVENVAHGQQADVGTIGPILETMVANWQRTGRGIWSL